MVGKLQNSRGNVAIYKKARGIHSVMNFGGIAQVDALRFKSGDIIKVSSSVSKSMGGDLITQTYYSIQKVRNGVPDSKSSWLFDVLPATRMDFNNQKSNNIEQHDLLGECERLGIVSGLCTKASVSALNHQYALCNQNDIAADNCTLINLKKVESDRGQQEECVSLDIPNASLEYGCDKVGIANMQEECKDLGMSIDPTAIGERQCNSGNILATRLANAGTMYRKLFLWVLAILLVYLFATKTKTGRSISKSLL